MATSHSNFDTRATANGKRPFDFSDPLGTLRHGAVGRLRDAADEGKRQLAGTLDGLVQAAHELADKLEGSAGASVGDYARRAADTVEHWQQVISTTPIDHILDSGRDLVRRSPAAALGISVATGFLISRLVKAAGGAR